MDLLYFVAGVFEDCPQPVVEKQKDLSKRDQSLSVTRIHPVEANADRKSLLLLATVTMTASA